MFWKKKPDKKRSRQGADGGRKSSDLTEGALDTTAALLREFGESSFDLEQIDGEELRELCERWARHALVGTAPPGGGASDAPPQDDRDWAALQRFFHNARHRETEAVSGSLDDFRDLIWAFVRGLGSIVSEDRKSEHTMEKQLTRLREAVESHSTKTLRREAEGAVTLIGRLMEERRDLYREQLEELARRLESMRGELADARKRMKFDSLTRLYNRASFDEHVQRVVGLSTFLMKPAYLFMADVDHFKWVNDTYGHQTGDEVLRQLAGCVQDGFRRKDDFAARYGGEEFVMVIQEVTDTVAESLAERLMDSVRDLRIPVGDDTLRFTISIGTARFHPGETAEQWVERADRALYEAKLGGRDRQVRARDPSS